MNEAKSTGEPKDVTPVTEGSGAAPATLDKTVPVDGSGTAMTLEEPLAQTQAHTIVPASKNELLRDLSINAVYLMGTSFILGSLFTVFVLLVLDFMRRNTEEEK